MKKIILFATALLILLGATQPLLGKADVSPAAPEFLGELPPPTFLMVTNVTESTISIAWTHVPGAAQYKISVFNMDTGMPLPTNVATISPSVPAQYTISNLPAATNIRIGVSATSFIGGNFGEELALVQQTDNIIIIDGIVFAPCEPGNGIGINFTNDIVEMSINTTPSQSAPPLYQESTLYANKPNGSKPGWTINLGMVGRICPSGSMKYICRTEGSQNVTSLVNQTQGILVFKNNGLPVLTVSDFTRAGDLINFKVTRLNVEPGNSYTFDNRCRDVSLTGNPCTQGTYAQAGTPPVGSGHGMARGINDDESNFDLAATSEESLAAGYTSSGNFNDPNVTSGSRNSGAEMDGQSFELVPSEESITAAPNPFNDFTNIQYQITKQSPVTMTLFNAMGQTEREIFTAENEEPGYYTRPMDVSDLAPGIYFLTIQTESGRKITTVIKQ